MQDFMPSDTMQFVLDFMVFGKPMPKERARSIIDRKSGRIIHYTPKKTSNYQERVAEICGYIMNRKKILILTGGIGLKLSFVFKAPKSRAGRISCGGVHLIRPDIDNVTKAILDGLSGVLFLDDKQVCDLVVSKRYGNAEFARVEVYKVLK